MFRLSSHQAIEMSLYVVRAFVKLRKLLASNRELARRLDELEARITRQFATHDHAITGILKTIRELQQQVERIQRLPKAQQRFVMQTLETLLKGTSANG